MDYESMCLSLIHIYGPFDTVSDLMEALNA